MQWKRRAPPLLRGVRLSLVREDVRETGDPCGDTLQRDTKVRMRMERTEESTAPHSLPPAPPNTCLLSPRPARV
ncbi:hypothetical protein [Caudoviricetes sp.]|nr:hypothetical protein [Caudoviricetes sp.]